MNSVLFQYQQLVQTLTQQPIQFNPLLKVQKVWQNQDFTQTFSLYCKAIYLFADDQMDGYDDEIQEKNMLMKSRVEFASQFWTQANYRVNYTLGVFYLPSPDVFFRASVMKNLSPEHSLLAQVLILPQVHDERFCEHKASFKFVHDYQMPQSKHLQQRYKMGGKQILRISVSLPQVKHSEISLFNFSAQHLWQIKTKPLLKGISISVTKPQVN